MGGGTFDITLLEINDGVFHVLSTNGNTYLGGEDFDNRIVDWLTDEFKREKEVDLSQDKLALQRVKEAAEKGKRELSFTTETEINLPFIYSQDSGSKHIQSKLTRQKLEELTKDLIEKSFPFIDQALEDAKLEPENIDEVILVGGQTRMPLIRSMIADFFRKEPKEKINPDEIVAMGAAIQAGILKGEMKDIILLLDVTPLSLGIEAEKDQFITIIEKNTTIPTKKTRSFTTVEHDQRRVRIHVLQGEEDRASENMSLARFDLVGIESGPAGVPQIDVTFEIDADGLVKVSARDVGTHREQGIEVKPSSGLTGEQIDKIMKREREREL
jgi:molecular chaperone DnaK